MSVNIMIHYTQQIHNLNLLLSCPVMKLTLECCRLARIEVNHSFRLFADLFSSIYGVYVPICLSQCVLSLIILKYELYLTTLIFEIKQDKDNNDHIECMMNRYKDMYKTFIDEFKVWKYIIKMNLLVNFFILWVIVATMINEPMAKKRWD